MRILWADPSSKPNLRAQRTSFLDRTAEVLFPFMSVLDESALMLGVLRFLSNVCEDSSRAGYGAMSSGKWLPTFRLSLLSASPRPLLSKTNKTGIVVYIVKGHRGNESVLLNVFISLCYQKTTHSCKYL
jgi:hypothetical protein